MLALPNELHRHCRATLLRCDQFDSHISLQAVFVTEELRPFQDGLPEGKSKSQRVDLCLRYLLSKSLQDGRPVLPIFLETLQSFQEPGDALGDELATLSREVSTALITSLQRQRQESMEAKDYLNVARSLTPAITQPQREQQGEVDVAEWFEESGDDIYERAYRVALAVFNGARYSSVLEAAHTLAERLGPAPVSTRSHGDQLASLSAVPKRRSERLRLARAHIEEARHDTGLGLGAIQVVALDDPTYPSAFLRYFWLEYDAWHDVLIEWLTEYATGRTADMRTRAAAAVGVVAGSGFFEIRDRILIPWARRDERTYRAAISKALGVVIWDDECSAQVRALLKSWTNSSDSSLRWAAARAYTHVGLRFPREAFDQWRTIANLEETHVEVGLTDSLHLTLVNPLHMSIVDAIVSLLLTAVETQEHYQPVFEGALEGLVAWADEDEKNRNRPNFSLPTFVMLTTILMPNVPPESDPASWPPAMLYLVDPQDTTPSSYPTRLADLFCRALRSEVTYAQTIETLHEWLERVDRDARHEPQMLVILQEIASCCDARMNVLERLKIHLRRWATHPRVPLGAARRALDHLGSS